MNLAVVIPALNEAETIECAISSARQVGTVIVVDDGSVDQTASRALAAGALVVELQPGRGYDGAIEAGFRQAATVGADGVLTYDADGEHSPSALLKASQLLKNCDLVVGIRKESPRFSESLFNLYVNLRFGIPDILCGLKGYRIELYKEHGCFDNGNHIGTQLALWALANGRSHQQVEVPIKVRLDKPRLGSFLKANFKILKALGKTILRHELSPGRTKTW